MVDDVLLQVEDDEASYLLSVKFSKRSVRVCALRALKTARQAAEALRRPLARSGAYWLFAFELVGTGMFVVPVLAGSCAYTIAEAARWEKRL